MRNNGISEIFYSNIWFAGRTFDGKLKIQIQQSTKYNISIFVGLKLIFPG